MTHNDFVNSLKARGQEWKIPLLVGIYSSTNEPIAIVCSGCGAEYTARPTNIYRNKNNWCKSCNQKAISQLYADKARNKGLELLKSVAVSQGVVFSGEYTKETSPMSFYCEKHQHRWTSTAKVFRQSSHCCPISARNNSNRGLEKSQEELVAELDAIYGENRYDFSRLDYTHHRKLVVVTCNKCHYTFNKTPESLRKGYACPRCALSETKPEREVIDYLHSIGFNDLVLKSRSFIPPLEIDIFIPSVKIGIEINGLYYHSELKIQDKNYHHRKYIACKEAGIRLIQVWEDEWRDRKTTVCNLLANALGVNNNKRVFARKCNITEVLRAEAQTFLETNHIQGFSSGQTYCGLRYQDELVAVAVFGTNKSLRADTNTHELIRYASSRLVVGGMGKLVNWYYHKYNKPITTYSDNTKFTGDSYRKIGFKAVKEVKPEYQTVWDSCSIRKSKSCTAKSKLAKIIPNMDWNKTEHEICLENKIYRVYDAGKVKWVYKD